MTHQEKDQTKWIHLLFRGSRSSQETTASADEYLVELECNNLVGATVPVLEFDFKNLQQLAKLLEELDNDDDGDTAKGLIITSPRVVDALASALEMIEIEKRHCVRQRIDSNLVFVVGEKSGRQCETKLGLKYNVDSSQAGSGQALAERIVNLCRSSEHFTRVKLLYPKGSLSDETIDNVLANEQQVKLESVVVYDTRPVDDIGPISIEALKKVKVSDQETSSRLIVNMIFFSPSGVSAFLKVDQSQFIEQLQHIFPNFDIEFRYSSIGKTTEAALLRNNLAVFCVSNKPNPSSLVESILKSVIQVPSHV